MPYDQVGYACTVWASRPAKARVRTGEGAGHIDGKTMSMVTGQVGQNVKPLYLMTLQFLSLSDHQSLFGSTGSTQDIDEKLRKMLITMVDDVRAVLIKLAFRVQRLRQLKLADPDEHSHASSARTMTPRDVTPVKPPRSYFERVQEMLEDKVGNYG